MRRDSRGVSDPHLHTNCVGWPDVVAQTLHLHDVNASCPGEATGGFISPTGIDNICRPYKAAYPLHVHYTGTQLAFALSYLRAHLNVRLVTLPVLWSIQRSVGVG